MSDIPKRNFVFFLTLIIFSFVSIFSAFGEDFPEKDEINGVESSVETADVQEPVELKANVGDYFIAGLEEIIINMAGELTYNLFAKKPSGMNFASIKKSVLNPYTFDNSPLPRNQVVHPLAGALFFTAARANNLDFWSSFAYTAASSWMMENLFQVSNTSINDLVTTTVAGTIAGEVFHRLGYAGFDLWKGLLWFVSPIDAANDVLRLRWRRDFQGRGISTSDIYRAEFFAGGGFSWCGDKNLPALSSAAFGGFGNIGAYIVYGEPFDHKSKNAFDQFSVDGQLFTDFSDVAGYIAFEGALYSWPFFQNTNLPSSLGISLNYKANFFGEECFDELNYSTNALGFFLTQKIPFDTNYFGWRAETNFIFLAASRIEGKNHYNFGPEAKIQLELETKLIRLRAFSELSAVFFQNIFYNKTSFSLDFKITKLFSLGFSDLFLCTISTFPATENALSFSNHCSVNAKIIVK